MISLALDGQLEPLHLDNEFGVAVMAVKAILESGEGMIVAEDTDGNRVAIAVHRIISITEL